MKASPCGLQLGTTIIIVLLGFSAGACFGQQHDEPTTPPPLLAGPRVNQRQIPGIVNRYVAGDVGGMRMYQEPVPLPVFFEALGSLGSQPDQASLALSPAQQDAIAQIIVHDRDEASRFLEAHTSEIHDLLLQTDGRFKSKGRQAFNSLERLPRMLDRVLKNEVLAGHAFDEGGFDRRSLRRRSDRKPLSHQQDGVSDRFELHIGQSSDQAVDNRKTDSSMQMHDGDAMDNQSMQHTDAQDAKARLEALWAEAPSNASIQTRVWMVLNDDQQQALSQQLEAYQQQRQAQREQNRLEREIARRTKDARDTQDIERRVDKIGQTPLPRDKAAQVRKAINLDPALLDRAIEQLQSGSIPDRLWKKLPQHIQRWLERLPEEQRADALATFLTSYRDGVYTIKRKP